MALRLSLLSAWLLSLAPHIVTAQSTDSAAAISATTLISRLSTYNGCRSGPNAMLQHVAFVRTNDTARLGGVTATLIKDTEGNDMWVTNKEPGAFFDLLLKYDYDDDGRYQPTLTMTYTQDGSTCGYVLNLEAGEILGTRHETNLTEWGIVKVGPNDITRSTGMVCETLNRDVTMAFVRYTNAGGDDVVIFNAARGLYDNTSHVAMIAFVLVSYVSAKDMKLSMIRPNYDEVAQSNVKCVNPMFVLRGSVLGVKPTISGKRHKSLRG